MSTRSPSIHRIYEEKRGRIVYGTYQYTLFPSMSTLTTYLDGLVD